MVVVLPDPLTPITRITCGRGKASISSGLATGARIFAISSATTSLTPASLRPALEALARRAASRTLRRGRGAEVGRDQRLLDLVERRVVERGLGEQAGEILPEPVRRLAEAAAEPLEPRRRRSSRLLRSACRLRAPTIARAVVRRSGAAGMRRSTPHRREILGVAGAVLALDQHLLAAADQALQPARLAPRGRLAQPPARAP